MTDTRYPRVWPYPVNYGKENEVSADVLVIGGGLAGCHAAINAAKRGAKVAVVDKGAVIRSGSGGAGIDHWHSACTNPCSKISPEEMVEVLDRGNPYSIGFLHCIDCEDSYDTLLEVEKMGLPIRDTDDEFAGAPFRDEKTKLMFAYDYENKHYIRVRGGANMKPTLHKECRRLGVQLYEHIMTTGLLTEGGRQGARVVGATGVNIRTGEFYIFKVKASVLSSGVPVGIWIFSTELNGAAAKFLDPNNTGDGHAMAWRAGAEFILMELNLKFASAGGFFYPSYGTGNAHNTYFGCNIVDANGKEVPWVDRDGNILATVADRYHPAPGQKLFFHGLPTPYETQGPRLIPDLPERIKKGEFVLPLYADFPSMPEYERRAIWGLMIGNEGKTRIPVYSNYNRAGFDPDKDMLQANVMTPDGYDFLSWWEPVGKPPQWREIPFSGGSTVIDWDMKTTLPGLYAAGALAGISGCSGASTSGRYAGRKAAEYATTAKEPVINRKQVDEEKKRVYAPVVRNEGIGWKELQAGLCRIMQDYCGEYKSQEVLGMGLKWLESISESEAAMTYARNPHELVRTLECLTRLTVGEMIMQASLARKASSAPLDFKRLDYPQMDPPEWNKFVTIRLENSKVKTGELPFKYWLLPPNAPTYEENYRQHHGR